MTDVEVVFSFPSRERAAIKFGFFMSLRKDSFPS